MLDPSSNPNFSGRVTPASLDYPYGSSKDETAPAAGDGSPYFKARADDVFGFQQALVGDAGIIPDDNADTALASQQLRAAGLLLKWGSFKNKVVNGDFRINPDGTSFLTTDADEWTSGNWRSIISLDGGTIDGGNGNVDILNFIKGQTDVPGNPVTYLQASGHVSTGGGSEFVALSNKIEGVETFSNETATKLIWVKGSINGTIGSTITQNFGTGGAPDASVTVNAENIPVTTSWEPHVITVDVDDISGKTLGTNNDDNLQLLYFIQAGATFAASVGLPGAISYAGDLQIAEVQFENGRYATRFERLEIGDALQYTERYYQKINFAWFRPEVGRGQSSNVIATQVKQLRTPMRAPGAASFDASDLMISVRLDGGTATILPTVSAVPVAFGLDGYAITVNSGVAVNGAYYAFYNGVTTFNNMVFDSRL